MARSTDSVLKAKRCLGEFSNHGSIINVVSELLLWQHYGERIEYRETLGGRTREGLPA